MKIASQAGRLFSEAASLVLLLFSSLLAQSDPQGALDSFYVECGVLSNDTLLIQVRFASDNTDFNRIAGIGLPILISVNNGALVYLDTSEAATFAGSMVSGFALKSSDTDSIGGADPTVSPVHFVIGAVSFDSGVTGQGVFANLKLVLSGDTATINIDTLSTQVLNPSLATERAEFYTPGWKPGGFACSVISSVRDLKQGTSSDLPSRYQLTQNYPNPFNATTSIEFALPQSGRVTLELYNILGQKIRTLVDQELSLGYKQVVWDGTDQNGNHVASGVYFYRLMAKGDFIEAKKMLLLR